VARLNAKPSIRIKLGSFVARYGGEDHVLGPVKIGLQSALRQAPMLKREDGGWRIERKLPNRPLMNSFIFGTGFN
jgi:hypothetical protein